ncbi:MAG: hypothetical protein QOC81_3340 [Thermoanaerobaculia bacterium]|jgi:hypothetical protein|nr:hypothetical protein [Thermoanaerobaculia bacterium]
MGTVSRKRKLQQIPPIFKDFIASVKRHFGFLEEDYGFDVIGPEFHGVECSIHYVKASTLAVSVLSEAGSVPWVRVTASDDGELREFTLDEYLQKYCMGAGPTLPISNSTCDAVIMAHSQALRKCQDTLAHG